MGVATDSFAAVLAVPRSREGVLPALRAVVLSRLLIWSAGMLAVLVGGVSSRAADFDPSRTLAPYGQPLDTLVAPGARWDSVWYLAVAHSGYGSDPARPAFFPLYPLLLRALGSDIVVGIALSLACFAIGARRLRLRACRDSGLRATWAMSRRKGVTLNRMSLFDLGCSCASRVEMRLTSLCACSNVTPGLRRATVRWP
jgi:hypothetical protein